MNRSQPHLPSLDPTDTPRQYRWYDWHIGLLERGSRAKLATPQMIEDLTTLAADCATTYQAATGKPPCYIILQTPGRILGPHYPGRLAGMDVLTDTRLPFGTFGIAHEITPSEPVPTAHQRWLSDT